MSRNCKKMQGIARIRKKILRNCKACKGADPLRLFVPSPTVVSGAVDRNPCWSEGGGFSPRKLYGTGSVKERGKGLRRTGVRRAAAAAPGPGRGGRVPTNRMWSAEPVLKGALRSSGFPLDQCTFLADSGRTDH